MNITRSWREQMVMLKWRFPSLCDKDLIYEEGQRESMLNRLMVKLEKTRTELEVLLAELQTY
ncbi:hypothetical protein SAMN04488029_0394 [Reichenbachiella faecimaris]|uniref:General stress protein CsbD n=1 Tax=Reichenbachiella faecimaris TaxID=692418 RepID=A0A1W2G6X5_REIFA|nr:hypothetical protein [Reichenbachiella faecimaris]SMD32056.1 hypothetical protein SAMN04488029_0394 [Reichenbachiella faecimaris]